MDFWRFLPVSGLASHLHAHHHTSLTLVSAAIAMVAAFTTLAVVDRIVALDRRAMRRYWISVGAVAMGLGIWAMHFTAMLAFHLPVMVRYEPGVTILSLIPAVIGSGLAIHVISRTTSLLRRTLLGGVPLTLGIGAMHFSGMEAMRMSAYLAYEPSMFAMSLVVCYVLAVLSLWVGPLAERFMGPTAIGRILAAIVGGLAVTGMHHTAMAAAVFVPAPGLPPADPGIDASLLAILVSGGATVIVGLTLVATFIDARFASAAQSLDSTQLRHRAVLEAMSDAVFTLDEGGRIQSVNRAGASCFGYGREELEALPFVTLVPERADLTNGDASSSRMRLMTNGRRRDGSLFPLELTLSHVTLGREPITIAVARDTTEQSQHQAAIREHIRRLEELSESLQERSRELALERDRAEAATRAKSDFLATMSHEIRTPMNGIIGTTELLIDSPLTAEQAEQLRIIRTSGEAMLHVINQILDFSKIEAGRLELDSVGFDLGGVVDAVKVLLTPAAERKDLDLMVRSDGTSPRLVGDPFRLRQVLLNLVSNAIKFTDSGRVTIEAGGVPDGTRWRTRLTVRDTGIGIDAPTQARLFTAFSQADASTTRRFGGTGLGLAISKRLIDIIGGTIGVESQAGAGSMFWVEFSLPIEAVGADLPAAATNGPLAPPASSEPVTWPLRVLLAEDNTTNQKVATFLLKKLGCEIEVAANGRDAVAAWRARPFDVVLMDCQMPVMDGYQATRAIRAESAGERVPIMAVTANVMDGDRERCLAAGMDDYVTKPLSRASLHAALRRLADRGLLKSRSESTVAA